MKKDLKAVLPWVIIIIFIVSLYHLFIASQEYEAKISYTKFSDLAEKFIRAEVVPYTDLAELGSVQAARDRGMVRTEGPGYVVLDGDIMKVKHG